MTAEALDRREWVPFSLIKENDVVQIYTLTEGEEVLLCSGTVTKVGFARGTRRTREKHIPVITVEGYGEVRERNGLIAYRIG